MSAATLPPPNPRRARTREALINAGLKLFSQKPVDAVSIDEIVGEAGVAKGSFFNHFEDKQHFSRALSAAIRAGLERQVDAANEGESDPLARLVGGMMVAARFALCERERALVMLRSPEQMTPAGHPLNDGLIADLDRGTREGLLRPEARAAGLLFWLGACQILMTHIATQHRTADQAAALLHDMAEMGLIGLGADPARARHAAERAAQALRAGV